MSESGYPRPGCVRMSLLCMLAYYVEWPMRQALAPLLFDDDDRAGAEATRTSVVAPAQVSPRAQDKARRKRTAASWPVHSSSAPCSTTWPPSLVTASPRACLGPNRSMYSLGPPRYSARPSDCSAFAWKVPSSDTSIFLIYR